jgi:hypothetical protein
MNENYNEVTDLGLAASLTASGLIVKRIDRTNPRRVVFCFEDSPKLREHIELYWSNELLIPASTLLEHVRQLKSRIYSR